MDQAEASYALYERVYQVVSQVPAGQVTTYGDVAQVVGGGCDGRLVGQALGAMGARAEQVPWQRVVNREGSISTRGLAQRALLEAEGVTFDAAERVILAQHRWSGPDAEWAAQHGFQTLPPRDAGEQAEQLPLF
jgi:methylated-DNA-protein-cysteine methyltransferase-like protein